MIWRLEIILKAFKDKPPSSQLLTSQTDNGPGGKATPPSAVRGPRRRNRPDGATPAPCRPEDKDQGFSLITT